MTDFGSAAVTEAYFDAPMLVQLLVPTPDFPIGEGVWISG